MFAISLELWAKYGWNDLLNWRDKIPVYALDHLSHFACVFRRVSSLIKTGEDTGNGLVLLKPQYERGVHRRRLEIRSD